MPDIISRTQLESACDRLVEAQQDLAAQCRQFLAFLDLPSLTREGAIAAQMPVRGAALQASSLLSEYLMALTAYTDSLPE